MRIVYGINPVREVLKTDPRRVEKIYHSTDKGLVKDLVTKAGKSRIKSELIDRGDLAKLAGSEYHQGVMVQIKGEFKYLVLEDIINKESDTFKLILILDNIQDPQNLGSLIRASVGAGVTGIIIPKDRSVDVTPAVSKASAGATEYVSIAKVPNIASAIREIKKANIWVAGLDGKGGRSIYKEDLKRDLAVVVGSEGDGIRRLVKEECDFLINIPMSNSFESLNAAQAGVVALFEAKRQFSLKD